MKTDAVIAMLERLHEEMAVARHPRYHSLTIDQIEDHISQEIERIKNQRLIFGEDFE